MTQLSLRKAVMAAALVVGLLLTFSGLTGAPRPALAADQAVTIQGFAYAPASLTINVGDSVTWTNMDNVPHTATSDPGITPAFDTGNLTNGQSGSVTFNTAGTFAYHCTVHPNMKATVVVQAAGGSSGSQQPQTGATAAAPSTGNAGPNSAQNAGNRLIIFAAGLLLAMAAGSGAILAVRRR